MNPWNLWFRMWEPLINASMDVMRAISIEERRRQTREYQEQQRKEAEHDL